MNAAALSVISRMTDTHQYSPPPAFESAAERQERLAAQNEAAEKLRQEKLELVDSLAVYAPSGELSTETLVALDKRNTGFFYNTQLEMIKSEETPAAVKAKLLELRENRAHGKPPGDIPAFAGPVAIKIELNFVNASGSGKSTGAILDADKQ